MLLARMGDLTNQLKPSDGIQTHRSWWVSAVAATEITKIGGSEFMDIGEGTRIPVARGRSGEVQGWLAQRGQPDTTPPVND
jgi:DNA-binding LytR/AlgR family response regulator